MNLKNTPILFLISVCCIFFSITISFINQQQHWINTSLLIVGIAGLLIVLLAILKSTPLLSHSSGKKILLAITMLFVVGILYVQCNLLAHKFDVVWDLTKTKQHTLNEESMQLIEGLEDEVRLTVFYHGMAPKYVEDLLKQYAKYSNGRIVTEVIDPVAQIGYAASFGDVIKSSDKVLIAQSKQERRDVNFTDKVLDENRVNNAIVRVTRKARKAYFLIGHGEASILDKGDTGLAELAKALMINNISPKTLLLSANDSIPSDCDVLIIAGPKNEIDDRESDIIEKYMLAGGDVLFMVENVIVSTPDVPLTEDQLTKNPSLNNILNKWGVNVGTDVVVDLANHAGQDPGSPATNNYMPHTALIKDLDYTFYVRPRSISKMANARKTIKAAPFAVTMASNSSWAESNRYLDVKFTEGEDKSGPVPISYVIWEPKEDNEESDTRMILITDADFVSNIFINSYSNKQMALNVINWLTETDYKIYIEENKIDVVKLELTSFQKRNILMLLIALPLFILVLGCMVWLRQRNGA